MHASPLPVLNRVVDSVFFKIFVNHAKYHPMNELHLFYIVYLELTHPALCYRCTVLHVINRRFVSIPRHVANKKMDISKAFMYANTRCYGFNTSWK